MVFLFDPTYADRRSKESGIRHTTAEGRVQISCRSLRPSSAQASITKQVTQAILKMDDVFMHGDWNSVIRACTPVKLG